MEVCRHAARRPLHQRRAGCWLGGAQRRWICCLRYGSACACYGSHSRGCAGEQVTRILCLSVLVELGIALMGCERSSPRAEVFAGAKIVFQSDVRLAERGVWWRSNACRWAQTHDRSHTCLSCDDDHNDVVIAIGIEAQTMRVSPPPSGCFEKMPSQREGGVVLRNDEVYVQCGMTSRRVARFPDRPYPERPIRWPHELLVSGDYVAVRGQDGNVFVVTLPRDVCGEPTHLEIEARPDAP